VVTNRGLAGGNGALGGVELDSGGGAGQRREGGGGAGVVVADFDGGSGGGGRWFRPPVIQTRCRSQALPGSGFSADLAPAPVGQQQQETETAEGQDAGLLGTSSFRQLEHTIGAAEKGSRWFLYPGVHPNPIEQDVVDAAQASQTNKCDGVIAFGGGSPLDVGKAARLLVKRPGFRLADFYSEPDWSALVLLVAIPTTRALAAKWGADQ